MKKVHYLLLVFILVLGSCSEERDVSCKVDIQLLSPEGYSALPFDEMTVVLTNQSQGTVYKAGCTAGGRAAFDVEYGYYTVSVHYQSVAGLVFSGRIESLALVPGQGEIPDVVELPLNRSETGALVIKEVYYAGCVGRLGEDYQADQYITLYNNSEETVYLDGLCIAVVDPANGESPWMKYTDMKRVPVNDLTWQFPGTGNDYPLAPGAGTTIAANAVNHTGGEYRHANSIDLSGVDWGFWDASLSGQDIQAGVKPMKLIAKLNPNTSKFSFPVIGPTIMVFSFQDIAAEEYINNMDNREPRPHSSVRNKLYLMIPEEWVIDCIECVENASLVTRKRVPDELNNTPAYIPEGTYSGKSLVRRKTVGAEGRIIYQDTNNASEDFEVSVPLLKK